MGYSREERFRAITTSFYKIAQGILLVYDISNKVTFDTLDSWIIEIKALAQPDVAIILVGNKLDLSHRRKVSQEEAVEYAKRYELPFFETSALYCTNVNVVFKELLVRTTRKADSNFDIKKERYQAPDNKVKLNNRNTKQLNCFKKR